MMHSRRRRVRQDAVRLTAALRPGQVQPHLSEEQRTDPDSAGSPSQRRPVRQQVLRQRRLQVFRPQQLVNHSTVFFMLFWLETTCCWSVFPAKVPILPGFNDELAVFSQLCIRWQHFSYSSIFQTVKPAGAGRAETALIVWRLYEAELFQRLSDRDNDLVQ